MPKTYTYNEVRAWAAEVVERMGGDYVYKDNFDARLCLYVVSDCVCGDYDCGGRPACMVAQMLHKSGNVSIENLLELQNWSDPSIAAVVHLLPFNFTEKAINFLSRLQSLQDDGCAWGEAAIYAQMITELYDRNEDVISEDVFRGHRDY